MRLSRGSNPPSSPPPAVAILITAAVYFGAAKLGLSLAFVAEQVTVVWPPTGIALTVLLLYGRRLWPGVMLGAFLANATTDASFATAAGIAAGNTLEAVCGAWLLQRFGFRPALDRVRDVLLLIGGGALASTAISASIGVLSLCVGGIEPWRQFPTLWWVWWLGDMMGDLVVAPLLLAWSQALRRGIERRLLAETFGFATAVGLVCLLVFIGRPLAQMREYPLHYTIFPVVVWAALRTGQLGTSAVISVASAIAIAGTAKSLGPLTMATVHESLIMVQLFMAVVACTALILGAATAERDATERARAGDFRALEVGAERLQLALEAARMGVWDWNISTGEVQWTENLEPIHGMARGTFSGTVEGFRALVHPEDRERVDAAIQGSIEEGTGYEIEFRSRFPDATVHWLAATGRVLRDGGRPAHMLGTAMDVTARHELEDALRERAEQLVEADRRKDEFLAMLGHELRNPLAPLSASLELLGRGVEDRARFLDMANRQVKHLVRLVDDLLDVSRITLGKIALRRESVPIADVVDHALDLTRPLIDAHHHRLSVALPPGSLHVEGDAARLAQALSNLLVNAANYTPAGGAISLSVARAGNEVAIRVRDTGIGLAPELLPEIFELFVQGEPASDRARGGLGIGLTLVRGLVAMHGGRVEARSGGPGLGSEFTMWLPGAAEGAVRRSPFTAAREERPRPLRVLIVEDNADAAESLKALLDNDGHDVRLAADALEALQLADRFAPEVVLSDLGLPEIDGYELAARLRTRPVGARAVLVAISGYGGAEDKRRAAQSGFDEYLLKPVDLDQLRTLLRRAGAARAPA